MGQAKEQILHAIGGLQFGETSDSPRLKAIERIEDRIRQGVPLDQLEPLQRQLCELKGIDFDAPDDEWD